jgi:hypothetical protein
MNNCVVKRTIQNGHKLLMDSILEISLDRSKTLLFGLLVNCIFSENAERDCPLRELRNNLSIENKHDHVMELSKEEVNSILVQHEECYQKKLPDSMR